MLTIENLLVTQGELELRYPKIEINAGERVAIQGRSGVGKTTLLHVIAGFTRCSEGSVHWHSSELTSLEPEQRPVGLLFQDHNLFEHLSVAENLALGFSGPAPEDQIQIAAAQLGVAELLQKRPGQCSGGQRQRIGLIRTLLRPEPLVLLDEPFAELDPTTREIATQWVRQTAISTGKTLLLVTHQEEDVERVAERLITL